MVKTLVHDAETGELRLRYSDLWQGNHEVTEYRVMDAREGGRTVRKRADLDGRQVLGIAPDLYIRDQWGYVTHIWTDNAPVRSDKTPCPRASNARRKCGQCAALAA